jgi:hypothetical protein
MPHMFGAFSTCTYAVESGVAKGVPGIESKLLVTVMGGSSLAIARALSRSRLINNHIGATTIRILMTKHYPYQYSRFFSDII